MMWGEFGRTPRVNNGAGRDHWSRLAMGFLAGGGMRTGQVIGSSSRYAEDAKDRPVHLQEVFATLYHNLGIDVQTSTGRPQRPAPVPGRPPHADPGTDLIGTAPPGRCFLSKLAHHVDGPTRSPRGRRPVRSPGLHRRCLEPSRNSSRSASVRACHRCANRQVSLTVFRKS